MAEPEWLLHAAFAAREAQQHDNRGKLAMSQNLKKEGNPACGCTGQPASPRKAFSIAAAIPVGMGLLSAHAGCLISASMAIAAPSMAVLGGGVSFTLSAAASGAGLAFWHAVRRGRAGAVEKAVAWGGTAAGLLFSAHMNFSSGPAPSCHTPSLQTGVKHHVR